MGEVVQYQQPQSLAASFSMSDMERVALAIAKGGLFGSTDPNAVLTLCMLAQAEGQHPAVVFRDYHIISGKPAKKSEAMQRDFLMGGGKIEWHQLDDDCVDATFSHPTGGTVRIAWDNARVAQAQLGGNAMHKKYPRQMKKARVIAEGVRTVWPSATSGLYETGEVQDIAAEKPTPAAPQAKRARDLKAVDTPEPPMIEQHEEPDAVQMATWAEKHIEHINRAPDLDKLDTFVSNRSAKLAELPDNLRDACQRAYDARRIELAAPADEPGEDDVPY